MTKKKKLFCVLIIPYLLFGMWFGALNWNVAVSPDTYDEGLRVFLYPIQTCSEKGLFCSEKKCLSDANGKLDDDKSTALPVSLMKKLGLAPNVARALYITEMAFLWPAKIVVNLVLIFGVVFTVFVSAVCYFIFLIAFNGFLGIVFHLISLLL